MIYLLWTFILFVAAACIGIAYDLFKEIIEADQD